MFKKSNKFHFLSLIKILEYFSDEKFKKYKMFKKIIMTKSFDLQMYF